MKSLIAKFRISAALDAGKTLSRSLRQKIAVSDELRRFESDTSALVSALKDAPPESEIPATIHRSIMDAVRNAERVPAPKGYGAARHWLPPPALASLLLLLAILWALLPSVKPRPPAPGGPEQALAAATTALEMGDEVARGAPAEVVAPLTDELARLQRDLDHTTQFVLASLP